MTTAVTTPDRRSRTGPSPGWPLALPRLLLAEWTKQRTLRSTWIIVVVAVGSSVGLAHLNARTVADRWPAMSAAERAAVDPANTALVGVVLTTVLLGALAARSIAIEYSTGMIDVTFLAGPGRGAVVTAKAVLAVLTAAMVALPTNVVSFLIGVTTLDAAGVDVRVTVGEAVGAVASGTGAVALFALIGLALGALTRRTAASNIALAVLVLGGQILAAAVPSAARPYLPSAALEASVSVLPRPALLGSGTALVVLAGQAALLAAAAARAVRSDR